jgi:hypothetical protein
LVYSVQRGPNPNLKVQQLFFCFWSFFLKKGI